MSYWQDIKLLFTRNSVDTLILFVTNRCNLKCHFCFYADNLNTTQDLPLYSFMKMAKSIRGLRSLLLSGGEPFLRQDLAQIVGYFSDHSGIRFVSIPTNGMFLKNIEDFINGFVAKHPEVTTTISFSLDGFAPMHDKVRHHSGAYVQAISTLEHLLWLRSNYPNLRVQVSTVVMPENHAEIDGFIRHLASHFSLDYHNLEIIRSGMEYGQHASREVLEAYKSGVLSVQELYHQPRMGPVWAFRGQERLRVQTAENLILKGSGWRKPCLAGKTIAVVDANGDLRACELRAPTLDLRQYNYDLRRAINSAANYAEVLKISDGKCFCTHGCFINASMRRYPSTILKWLKIWRG